MLTNCFQNDCAITYSYWYCYEYLLPQTFIITRFYQLKTFYRYDGQQKSYFFAICVFLFEFSVHILPPFFCQVACLFFFFLMSMKGLFVYSGLRKGRGSGIRLCVSELCLCHLSTVTLSELSDFLAPPFPHLLHEVNNNSKLVVIVRVQWDGPCEVFSRGLDRVSAPRQPLLLLFDFIGWTYCGWASGVRVKHIWWMYTYLNSSTKSA